MTPEERIIQQSNMAKALEEHFLKVQAVVVKYGGTAWLQHDEIDISVPKGHMEDVLREIKAIPTARIRQ